MARPGDKPTQEVESSENKPVQEMSLSEREKALKEREEALERDLKKLNLIRSHLHEYEATTTANGKPLTLSEIHEHRAIEGVKGENLNDVMALEAFMNEPVTIHVYTDGTPGSLEVITPTVNGVNQPIIRGRDQTVKRKYVEVLARSKVTVYRQEVADPSHPERIQMVPITNLTAPFVVREDKNPKGRAWLEHILAQPA